MQCLQRAGLQKLNKTLTDATSQTLKIFLNKMNSPEISLSKKSERIAKLERSNIVSFQKSLEHHVTVSCRFNVTILFIVHQFIVRSCVYFG